MPKNISQKYGVRTFIPAALCTLLLSACGGGGGGGSTDPNASSGLGAGPGVVIGKAIDATSRKGVNGAAVKLFVDNTALSATTQEDDSATADSDEKGDFEFRDVPAGQHRLRIESPSYASYETWVTVQPSTTLFYAVVGSNGKVELQLGCATDAYVTSDATALPGATVYASASGSPEIVGTADDAGKVVLTGLAQNTEYLIIAPALDRAADGTADGVYDYLTTSRLHKCSTSDKTLALDMKKAGRDDLISVAGGNFYKYNSLNSYYPIAPGDDIQIIYNYPVSLDSANVLLHYDGFLFADGVKGVDIATTATLSAGNTLLTLHPQQSLPVNARVDILGTISAVVSDEVFVSNILGSSLYVFDPAALGDGTGLYADNYNTHTAQPGSAGLVSLKFPELVKGSVTVLSYSQNGKSVTPNSPVIIKLDAWGSEFRRDKYWGGCTSGTCGGDNVFYRVALSGIPSLEDNQPDASNTVTVAIDATDAEGNHLIKTVTLPVE